MADLRYVVLHHAGIPRPHFDLMFETAAGSALETFRCAAWPIEEPAVVERLGEHRRKYLDYEGPVGGGRGYVRRIAAGTCRLITRSDDRRRWELDESMRLEFHAEGGRWRVRRES